MTVALSQVSLRRGSRGVLDRLDLAAAAGRLTCLVGPNGSGKSTAVKVMAGVLAPDAGRVLIDGRAADQFPPGERARRVGYLPQDFTSHWDLTVRALLALGLGRGMTVGWLPGRTPDLTVPPALIGDFELEPLLDRRLSTLSGGERARAACAAIVAGRPVSLLADEPTASLDIGHQIAMMRLLRRLAAAHAVLVVVHDINLALRFADEIVVLDAGRVAFAGSPGALLATDILDRVFAVRFTRLAGPDGVVLAAG